MEEREELMRAYLGAWNDRDAARIASFFADEAVYEDHGAGATALGPEGIRDHAARVHAGFPDLRFELVRAAHGDDFTAGEWRSAMTHLGDFEGLRPTGRVVESSGVDVATLDADGRIVRLDSYYDGAEIMRDLGLLPARGSRLETALARAASLLRRG
ncbi:MAG TPA: ester cyclase [Solirubrobacterales bacterium]|nr:ester cyclase [Solirubrobacterales bacterium]